MTKPHYFEVGLKMTRCKPDWDVEAGPRRKLLSEKKGLSNLWEKQYHYWECSVKEGICDVQRWAEGFRVRMDRLALKFHETKDRAVHDEIYRLSRELIKLNEPWRFVSR